MAKAPPTTPADIRIRMYRLGVGDCFLLTLPRPDGTPFQMLIDCGIHAAETGGPDRIRKVAEDIRTETGGRLDVIVGTHEHWDHLSGFFHAPDIFAACAAKAIWCAWTENPADPFAQSLVSSRQQAVAALWGAVRRLRIAGDHGATGGTWEGVLGFFGDSPGTGARAKAAADALRKLVTSEADIAYLEPGAPPFDSVSDDWRIFVLGPPRNLALLKHMDPRKGSGEGYPLAETAMAATNLAAAVGADDDPPFDSRFQIPLDLTQTLPFFGERYWADAVPDPVDDGEDGAQDWRRIGNAWLDGAEGLALKLDRLTNNTSLVLAIEVGPKTATDNPVLLFAADAQIGNWLSWQNVVWPDYAGRQVSGPDLLRRTVVYKVGHHASQNATLMTGGLETMEHLRLALVPTSAKMAAKVRWGTLPWPHLLTRLESAASDAVLRSDTGVAAGAAPDLAVAASDFCFDITIPMDMKVAR